MTNERNQSPEPWTAEQLREKLDEQIYFLRSSCAALDSGVGIEAIRIAIALRILLHLTFKKDGSFLSRALLDMLGYRDGITWMDQSIQGRKYSNTGDFQIWIEAELENGETESFPLAKQDGLADLDIIEGRPSYVPAFLIADRREQFVPFEQWWKTRFIDTPDGSILSRRDLVLDVANKDGGGHIDSFGTSHDYARLKAEGHGLFWSSDAEEAAVAIAPTLQRAVGDVTAASIRHIAHELLLTLSHHGVIEAPYS